MRKPETAPQRVLVEFSSLNIAKPMHMGHFRATVLGNFIKNINAAAANHVTTVNYLGDWGKQFGLVSLGYRHYGDSHLLETEPLKHLHSVYVRACQTIGSTKEGAAEASALATSLEKKKETTNGGRQSELATLWSSFRVHSLRELQQLYARMNISFDIYQYESECVQEGLLLVEQMIRSRIARREPDQSVTAPSALPGKRVVLLKSDGGTLYLTRDLAAAVSRARDLSFDRMHYVVDDGQREHFANLAHLLTTLGYDWAKPGNSPWPLHVRFARVTGASSRHGRGISLADVLDSAKREASRRMDESPYTRIRANDPEFDQVADQMGITWLMVEMLRKPRLQPQQFGIRVDNEEDELSRSRCAAHSRVESRDLTGLALQYCHARLCSLEQNAVERGLLNEPVHTGEVDQRLLDAIHSDGSSSRPGREVEEEVCSHLAMFSDVLTRAYVKYESDEILRYCTRLSGLVNRAWRFLPVLTADSEKTALVRMAIFLMARNTLATCLSLIGAKPLTKL